MPELVLVEISTPDRKEVVAVSEGELGKRLVFEVRLRRTRFSWPVEQVEVSPDSMIFWSGAGGFLVNTAAAEKWQENGKGYLVSPPSVRPRMRVMRCLVALQKTIAGLSEKTPAFVDARSFLKMLEEACRT